MLCHQYFYLMPNHFHLPKREPRTCEPLTPHSFPQPQLVCLHPVSTDLRWEGLLKMNSLPGSYSLAYALSQLISVKVHNTLGTK